MITEQHLQDLLAFQANGRQVLSLYLDTNIAQQGKDAVKLQAKGLMKATSLAGASGVSIAVEKYLDLDHDWGHSGVAIFCDEQADFFMTYASPMPFRNRVRVGNRPYVKPIVHLLDHYAHFGVVLVDKVGGRFYLYHLGALTEQDGYMGEEVRGAKRGRGSSVMGMRGGQEEGREEEVVQRNLRETAVACADFFAAHNARRLFLGGTPQTLTYFREQLPKQLQSCIAGTFAIDMDASEHVVREQALTLLKEANDKHEKQMLEQLVSRHAQGNSAVAGLDDTLKAVSERRVQTLIVKDGYQVPGYAHEESGFVVANLALSPMGEEELVDVKDIVSVAVHHTMANGGDVVVITVEDDSINRVGQIGALLRF